MTTIKKQNLYVHVIEHLKQYIVEQELQPGSRLPTEAELASRLGVSRLSIREALKVLESLGVVQTRPRDGSRLMALQMKPMTDHLRFLMEVDGVSLAEMSRARAVLESAILPSVIENATEEDFARLEAAIEQMRIRTRQGEQIAQEERVFYQVLATATHNRALEGISAMLHEFFEQLQRTEIGGEEQRKSIAEHECIVQALRKGDSAAAQKVMKERLHFSMRQRPFC